MIFLGYENADWFIPSPALKASVDQDLQLTPDQIRETLNYFSKLFFLFIFISFNNIIEELYSEPATCDMNNYVLFPNTKNKIFYSWFYFEHIIHINNMIKYLINFLDNNNIKIKISGTRNWRTSMQGYSDTISSFDSFFC